MDWDEKIAELEKAKEQAKVLYFKYEGALEFALKSKEEDEKNDSKKK